jgi:hypothetical protein
MQCAGLGGCRCQSRLLQLDSNREAAAPLTIDAGECLRRFANAGAGDDAMKTVCFAVAFGPRHRSAGGAGTRAQRLIGIAVAQSLRRREEQ